MDKKFIEVSQIKERKSGKNDIKVFDNSKLNLKVRTIQNEDGSISINAEDAARGFGWTTVATSGNEVVRWARLNDYCKEFGFDNRLAKDDYIPESLFYLLGMKASNKAAQEFQKWLAVDVIPSIRTTGSYNHPKKLSAIEQLQLQNQAILEVNEKVENLENNLPLFNVECKELQAAVKKLGVELMGGKSTVAYKDNSLRGKVYSDIQKELKRQFQVTRYEAIKRCQLPMAYEILEKYKLPLVLKSEIEAINNQISFK